MSTLGLKMSILDPDQDLGRLRGSNRFLFTMGDNMMQSVFRSNFTRKSILLLMALALILLPTTVSAQDPDESDWLTYTTDDGSISFEYPDTWSLNFDVLEPALVLTNGDFEDSLFVDPEADDALAVFIVLPQHFPEVFPEITELPRSPRELLEFLIFDAGDEDVFTEIEEGTLNGHRAVFANFNNEGLEGATDTLYGQVFALDLDDGDLALVMGVMTTDDYAQYQETVVSIAASSTLKLYEEGDFRRVSSPDLNLIFQMPAEYYYSDDEVPGAILIASSEEILDSGPPEEGDLIVSIITEQYFTEFFDVSTEQLQTPEMAIELVVEILAEDFENGTVSDLETISVENAPVAELLQLTFEADGYDGAILAFELPDGRVVTVSVVVNAGELSDFEDIILQIASSIQALEDMEAVED